MLVKLVLYFLLVKCIVGTIRLDEKYFWKQLDYEYPSEYARQKDLDSGALQPENLLPFGIEHFREKVLVTLPRWRDGIPATLAYIDTDATPSGSPKLIPYPSWRGNRFGDCENGLQFVVRIHVDKCNRLWVFDAGYSGTFTNRTQVCPPAMIIYDLETNKRIHRYKLNEEDYLQASLVSNIVVDIGRNCDDTYAYLADPLAYGMIVYSLEQNQSWRFNHPFFFPDPMQAEFNIGGFNYPWLVGVLGMALSEPKPDGYRTLYFTSLTSYREFNVSTRILQDKTRVADNYHDFNAMNERGPNGHIVSHIIDQLSGTMLFSLVDQNAVGCWHTSKPYLPENHHIIDSDNTTLIFQSDLQLDENRNVWIISNRMPIFFLAQLNYNEINFRIFSAPFDELVRGTQCDPQLVESAHNRFENEYQLFNSGWSTKYPEWWTKSLFE